MRMSDDDMGNDVSGLASESCVSALLRKRLSQRETKATKKMFKRAGRVDLISFFALPRGGRVLNRHRPRHVHLTKQFQTWKEKKDNKQGVAPAPLVCH